MKGYMVKVWITCMDDVYDEEYTGVIHRDRESARIEYLKAKKDFNVEGAYIEEVEA